MAIDRFRRNGYLYDSKGSPLMSTDCEENKSFAVLARCGHCGNGYYIPILFTVYCNDLKTAIEIVKSLPRVKRDKKDAIMEAFEISRLECLFLKAINDLDPYLKGYFDKDSKEIQSRRIINRDVNLYNDEKFLIKEASEFSEKFVLQRHLAPIIQGNKIVYKRIDKQQLLYDIFYQNALKSLKKKNVALLTMYYQMYGKNNDLGLILKNNKFLFVDEKGKMQTIEIPSPYMVWLENRDCLDLEKPEDSIIIDETKSGKSITAIERFEKRMQKHQEIIENGNNQPGQ